MQPEAMHIGTGHKHAVIQFYNCSSSIPTEALTAREHNLTNLGNSMSANNSVKGEILKHDARAGMAILDSESSFQDREDRIDCNHIAIHKTQTPKM
jgi:hypothetical protein